MKPTPRFLPGATAASLAAAVAFGSFSASTAQAQQTPLTERLVVSNGSTLIRSDLAIDYAEHNLPTVLSENVGSRIELTDSSITARLINDGSIDRLSVMAVQAKNGSSLLLDGVTIDASARGGASGSRAIGISVRNEVNRTVNTTRVTANNVTINVDGSSLQAHDGYGVGAVYPGAIIDLTGNSVINALGAYHYGIFAGAGATVNSTGTTISTDGQRGIGVYANAANQGGAVINLTGGSVTTLGNDAHGLFSMRESGASARNGGHTSAITGENVAIETRGDNSVAVYADRGGNISLTGGSVTTSGMNSAGLVSSAQTSSPAMAVPSHLSATGTSVNTSGANAFGVAAVSGGDVELDSVSVNTSGQNAHALLATGTVNLGIISTPDNIDPNIVDGTPARITGTGVSAIATHASASAALAEREGRIELTNSYLSGASTTYKNGVVYARDEGYIKLDGGSVTHSVEGTTFGNAVNAEGHGSLIQLNNATITTNATGIGNTQLASGVYASDGGRVEIADSTVGTVNDRAIGLRVAHTGSSIETENTDVTTYGHSAHAVHVFSVPGGSEYGVRADLDGGNINTSGENAYGLYAQNAGSTITSSANITTTGNAGFGAFTYGGGQIILTGGTISTSGEPRSGTGTYGLISAGAGSRISSLGNVEGESTGITVRTYGAGASAVRADTGGSIDLKDATISTVGSAAHALQAVNEGSSLSVRNSTAGAAAQNASAAHASDKGYISVANSTLSGITKGSNTGVVQATTEAIIDITNSEVNKIGEGYGNAVYAASGARVNVTGSQILNASDGEGTVSLSAGVYAASGGRVTLVNSEVSTTGTRAYGVRVAGDDAHITATDTVISTEGNNSHAVQAFASTSVAQTNSVTLNGGEVYTEGTESWALYAQNAGAIINSSADIQTTGKTGFAAFALNGGTIYLNGGNIETHGAPVDPVSGSGSIALLSSGVGSNIISTGTSLGGSGINVRTTGAKASAAVATNGGLISLRDASLRTEGGEAYGIHASGNATVYAYNTTIKTTGSRSSGIQTDGSSSVRIEKSRINSSFYGVRIYGNADSSGEVYLSDTTLHSTREAFHAVFGSQNDETVNIRVDGNSEITSDNNTLLSVSRIESASGDRAQVVNFSLGSPAGFPAGSSTTVARGDILDTSANKGANDRLNIHVGADARLYSDNIQGYDTIGVYGTIGNNVGNNALRIGAGQSVSGTGIITKDVVLDGGQLSTDVRIRGNLDLGESAREVVDVAEGQSVTVDAGKQAIIAAVTNANVDASGGAAVIDSISGTSTVKTGNWGATIGSAASGTIDASEGTAKVERFEGTANLQTGSGGATVGTFAGGSVNGSGAGESQVSVGELSGGSASNVALVVSNDGSSTGPTGNVSLENGKIGGNGTVNAALSLTASTFAAGSSVGRLDIADSLTLDASSIYEWEINDATGAAGIFASGWDFSQVEGVITFETGARFAIMSLGLDNLTGMVANFDQNSDYSWLVAVATDGIIGWENLQLELADFLNAYNGEFDLEVRVNGSGDFELYVNYSAVPEPTTVALLLSGAALLTAAALRRRNRSGSAA